MRQAPYKTDRVNLVLEEKFGVSFKFRPKIEAIRPTLRSHFSDVVQKPTCWSSVQVETEDIKQSIAGMFQRSENELKC